MRWYEHNDSWPIFPIPGYPGGYPARDGSLSGITSFPVAAAGAMSRSSRSETPAAATLALDLQCGIAGYRSGDSGAEDLGETPGLAHPSSPITRRRPDRYNSPSSGLRSGILLGTTNGVIVPNFAMVARASSSRPRCA